MNVSFDGDAEQVGRDGGDFDVASRVVTGRDSSDYRTRSLKLNIHIQIILKRQRMLPLHSKNKLQHHN